MIPDVPRKPPALLWPGSNLVARLESPQGSGSSFRTRTIGATRPHHAHSVAPSPLEGADLPGGQIEMTAVGREVEREASAHTEQRQAAIFSVKEAESTSVGSGYNILLPFNTNSNHLLFFFSFSSPVCRHLFLYSH